MHRFFYPQITSSLKEITITESSEIHHIKDVLHLKKNSSIELFTGKGVWAKAKISSIAPKKISVIITAIGDTPPRTPKIILGCAIPKKGKFELIIEKATELGVDEIIPLKTERTEVKLTGERSVKKNSRFQTVALNAAKQCQSSFIPAIHFLTPLSTAIKDLKKRDITIIIPSLEGKTIPLVEALTNHKKIKKIAFLIGPEGDFSDEEYQFVRQEGGIPVSLGPNVLKVETAAITVLAAANLVLRPHEKN